MEHSALREIHTADSKQESASSPVPVGSPAPELALLSKPGEFLSLSDFKGQSVVLVFYPADWSPVCGDQVVLYSELLPIFEDYDVQVLGISVDSVWCHRAYAKDRNFDFPLLADFDPKGVVAQTYGVYRDDDGTRERAPLRH
jgi:peroxiredoxin